MSSQTVNLTFVKGETFNGIQFTVKPAGTPMNLSDTDIIMVIKERSKTGHVVDTFRIGSGITKTDAVNGVFIINPFKPEYAEGFYYYHIKFVTGDVVKFWIIGSINETIK
jgi:hypothetical protein